MALAVAVRAVAIEPRSTKMGTFRVRRHVNPLKVELMTIAPAAIAVPARGFLEVELGSAEGDFLFARAREEPAGTYVGVEIRRDMAERANRDAAAAALDQVSTVFANMSVDLPRLFAAATVTRFHVNFPDPWFKSRQKKRRVLSPQLVAEMEAALVPAGEVHVMTDIFDIALDAMAALEEAGYRNVVGSWSFARASAFAARSRREVICAEEGRAVWRLRYRKPGS